MKKILFFAFAAIMAMSCKGPEGPMGPMGPTGEKGEGANWDVYEVTAYSNQWILQNPVNSLNSYYYYEISDPELTEFIVDNGLVNVYLFTEQTQSGAWIQAPLPFIRHKGKMDGSNEILWTETYDFDYTTGSIIIYFTTSDFMTGTTPPECTFRIVKNW